ncbi:alpha/beta hydrolase [Microbulbifer sp. 2304DJ12-6]|uniref:alpha/beta hydrolase n=1 Tax=Microbulbifer sp. 2304DJ12-6 TaxID=3233340 RepID=UPI0039B0C3B4
MHRLYSVEVILWVRKNYNIAGSENVVISGRSRAAFAALRYLNVIGGMLSQSGSFYSTSEEKENCPIYTEFDGRLLTEYKKTPKHPINLYLNVGLYEIGLGRVGVNRQFKDTLELKGYKLNYKEYKGGHSHLNWRHTLSNELIYFFGDTKNSNALQRTS